MIRTEALPATIRKSLAFLRMDFLFEVSYRLQFAFQVASTAFSILSFYFLATMIDGQSSREHLAQYGGDYFTFVLVGLAFVRFFNVGLVAFTTKIRQYMAVGVLESMLASPSRVSSIMLYALAWPLLSESVKTLGFLLFGWLALGASLRVPDPLALVLIMALNILTFSCMGLIAGSFILLFKRGDPLTWLLASLSQLLGGVLFPITVLPEWIQTISLLIPVTYALELLRGVLIAGYGIADLTRPLLSMALFTAILVPVSFGLVRWSIRHARITGGLADY